MLQVLVFGAALIAVSNSQATTSLFGSSECFQTLNSGERVTFIADSTNACWYWRCSSLGSTSRLSAQQCPIGTAVSSFFGRSAGNPCTELFDPESDKFDCTRKKFEIDALPPCFQEYMNDGTCKNGGTVKHEQGICTCDCTGTGFTDWDCSRTRAELGAAEVTLDFPNADDPCPNGIPRINWCEDAGNPCQNNGRCVNQCLNYICLCVSPFTAGRNCEQFDCTDGVECLNGGTCSRGENNQNQFASCECVPGFSGLMCEISPLGK